MSKLQNLSHISDKGIRDINEDSLLINEEQNIFGVFDGASSLVHYISPTGETGGYIASSIASRTFANDGESLPNLALEANKKIDEAHKKAGIDLSKNVNRFGTTAAVVKLNDRTAELLQIGDSVIIIIKADGTCCLPLGYNDQDIETMRKWRKLADQGASGIRKLVDEDVIRQREAANTSYGLLNGDSKLKDVIKSCTVSLENVRSILILTDGMFVPKSDPDADENWTRYVDLYQSGGVKEILRVVRSTEQTDQELTKYPRFKLHDDATAIALDLS